MPLSADTPPRWTLGILNDRETVDVPGKHALKPEAAVTGPNISDRLGSVRLLARDHDQPLGLSSIPRRNSASTLPTGIPWGFADPPPENGPKRTRDGLMILDPQPEESVNDPLNWPSWRRNLALLSVGLYCMVGGGLTPLLAAGFPAIARDYHVEVADVSLTTGMFMLGLGVGSVIASPTAILFGKRTVYLGSAAAVIVCSIWCALAPNFTSLVVARVFQGIAVSPVECLPGATIGEIFFLHEKAFRIGIYTLLLLSGKNIVPLISAAIMQSLSWRWVFWVITMVLVFCGALLFLFVPESFWDRNRAPKQEGPSWPVTLAHRLSSVVNGRSSASLAPRPSSPTPGSTSGIPPMTPRELEDLPTPLFLDKRDKRAHFVDSPHYPGDPTSSAASETAVATAEDSRRDSFMSGSTIALPPQVHRIHSAQPVGEDTSLIPLSGKRRRSSHTSLRSRAHSHDHGYFMILDGRNSRVVHVRGMSIDHTSGPNTVGGFPVIPPGPAVRQSLEDACRSIGDNPNTNYSIWQMMPGWTPTTPPDELPDECDSSSSGGSKSGYKTAVADMSRASSYGVNQGAQSSGYNTAVANQSRSSSYGGNQDVLPSGYRTAVGGHSRSPSWTITPEMKAFCDQIDGQHSPLQDGHQPHQNGQQQDGEQSQQLDIAAQSEDGYVIVWKMEPKASDHESQDVDAGDGYTVVWESKKDNTEEPQLGADDAEGATNEKQSAHPQPLHQGQEAGSEPGHGIDQDPEYEIIWQSDAALTAEAEKQQQAPGVDHAGGSGYSASSRSTPTLAAAPCVEKQSQALGMSLPATSVGSVGSVGSMKTFKTAPEEWSRRPSSVVAVYDMPGLTSSPRRASYTTALRRMPARTFTQHLRPYHGRLSRDSWLHVALRPLVLFSYPAVLWAALVYSCSMGWLVVLSQSVAVIFIQGSYHFNELQTGLTYISPLIGGILGTAVAGWISDVIVKAMSRRNGGIYEPEFRLIMALPVLVTTALGLAGFGWSAEAGRHWAVPTFFFGLVSFGCSLGSTTAITFVVDSHRQYSGEALVALNFCKNVLHGMVFSLFFTRWLVAAGGRAVFVCLAAVHVAVLLTTVPMYVFGKRARMWTVRKNYVERFWGRPGR
ncbi:hypothetical protein RB593_007585 [Gaeumannomyces tritici]